MMSVGYIVVMCFSIDQDRQRFTFAEKRSLYARVVGLSFAWMIRSVT